jgi:hypothetical protein
LEWEGASYTEHGPKALALKSFYTGLLGTVCPCSWSFNLGLLYLADTTLPASLSEAFSPPEVKDAFFSMNKNSSPGPDGFGPAFFTSFWDLVSPDVLAVFRCFYEGTIDLTRINRAFLVLLPKTDSATHPSQFRPISLQNCIMKAITKVLTTRLQKIIHSLVDDDQTRFLFGRRISENIVYAADLVRICHSRKPPPLCLKLTSKKPLTLLTGIA